MTLSISELLRDLPEEPIPALATIVQRARETINHEADATESCRVAVIVILKYAGKCKLQNPNINPDQGWHDDFRDFAEWVDGLETQYLVNKIDDEAEAEVDRIFDLRSGEPGFAVLSPEEKAAISQRVETIRDLIERSAITPKKKCVLFDRLSKFLGEVMKDGTKTDALFTFFGELALNVGLMAKNAKPAIEEAKEIMKIVVENRAKREGISLEKPEDLLRLPHLKDQ